MNVTAVTDHTKGEIVIKANGADAATLNIKTLGWGEAEAFSVLIVATLRGEPTSENAIMLREQRPSRDGQKETASA